MAPDTPIRPGEVVAVTGRAVGVWWLNACRVVYVVDETGPVSKFGFAYGTLPGHVESGEERFLVEWDTAAILERLASLNPTTLACQHGSAFRGDGAGLLRELARILEAEQRAALA